MTLSTRNYIRHRFQFFPVSLWVVCLFDVFCKAHGVPYYPEYGVLFILALSLGDVLGYWYAHRYL